MAKAVECHRVVYPCQFCCGGQDSLGEVVPAQGTARRCSEYVLVSVATFGQQSKVPNQSSWNWDGSLLVILRITNDDPSTDLRDRTINPESPSFEIHTRNTQTAEFAEAQSAASEDPQSYVMSDAGEQASVPDGQLSKGGYLRSRRRKPSMVRVGSSD